VNHPVIYADEPDTDADDLVPVDEIEYEEWDIVDIAAELELLLVRVQAARFSGA
jgi:hypothetical protein